jgi:hypothetical protein
LRSRCRAEQQPDGFESEATVCGTRCPNRRCQRKHGGLHHHDKYDILSGITLDRLGSPHCVRGLRDMPGNRNILFLIIGALIVVVAVLSYNLYQDRKQPEGLQINVGPNGLKVQGK